MRVMRSATLGVAFALGAAGAHAQTVVRQIDNEPVMTTVTETPGGTVITRRPLAPAPAPDVAVAPAPAVTTAATTYEEDETIGAAPIERTRRITRRVERHVVHHTRRAATERTITHAVHTTRRAAWARPLVLAPAQRRVIYRTLVQERVVPSVPGYPPFPPPVRAVAATTGYAVSGPTEVVEDEDYAPAAPVVAARVYPVGSVLPASVAVAPLPARAAVAVPIAQPYDYAVVGRRVLLVDPATDTVVADITP